MPRVNLPLWAGLSLAGISLYFSSTGLIHLFSGSSVTIGMMAVLFEVAKVAITVYLIGNFRWRPLQLGLSAALLLLSAISSLGIYGTLGRAYNEGRTGAVVSSSRVEILTTAIQQMEKDRDRLYQQVEAIPAVQGTNRRRVLAQLQPQIRQLDQQIAEQRTQLMSEQQTQTETSLEIGDLRFASELFGVSQDLIARGIITTLAFLLDPLALMLLLASGVKTARREDVPASEPVPAPSAPANIVLTMPRVAVPTARQKVKFVTPEDGLSAGASTLLDRFRSHLPTDPLPDSG
jgi:hypothetical protein